LLKKTVGNKQEGLNMKARRTNRGESKMTNEDRRLIVETLSEMKELKGEMREFKEHVIGRVEKLEKRESERGKVRLSLVSVLIATGALAVSIIINFFKG
jgi:L-lactate utilization protein LutB